MTRLLEAVSRAGRWVADVWSAWRDPFDVDPEPNSDYPGEVLDDLSCPDTQPSAPGALDTDLARLQ